MKSRLILADDHQVVRHGLRDMVRLTLDLEVVGEAADGVVAERLARTQPADLLILDVALPGRRGTAVLESLRADGIGLPVLFFSMYPAGQYSDYARRAGAQGFISKDVDAEALMAAVRRILSGGTSFPGRSARTSDVGSRAETFAALSRREFEVMQALARGTKILDIAAGLGISAQSVTTYRRRLLEKLGVASNAELATLAAHHGYL